MPEWNEVLVREERTSVASGAQLSGKADCTATPLLIRAESI